jgi:hypothetical protein
MSPLPLRRSRRSARAGLLSATIGTLALASLPAFAFARDFPAETHFYSTAVPPLDYPGPSPVLLAMADTKLSASEDEKALPPTPTPAPATEPAEDEVPRIANASTSSIVPHVPNTNLESRKDEVDSISQALQAIAECKVRFASVKDYTCTFFKRERMPDGKLTSQHVMVLKARTRPQSIYLKFVKPNAGREAIYVAGRHKGKALVHDVGIGKLLAGTLALDPKGEMAMEDCRHPITEAGIGHLIDELSTRWSAEMKHGETVVTFHPAARVGLRSCTMIESTHPLKQPGYLFHTVKVYIDQENRLPIRFEGYDWPRRPGEVPELMEEYTYHNLKINTGLTEHEFDPKNKQYSFGRF